MGWFLLPAEQSLGPPTYSNSAGSCFLSPGRAPGRGLQVDLAARITVSQK